MHVCLVHYSKCLIALPGCLGDSWRASNICPLKNSAMRGWAKQIYGIFSMPVHSSYAWTFPSPMAIPAQLTFIHCICPYLLLFRLKRPVEELS